MLRRLLSPNNVPFASQTQAKQSNTNYGTRLKLGGHGDGLCVLCMNFAKLELTTMIVFTRSKPCLGKGFLRRSAERSKLSTFYEVYTLDHLD